MLRAMPAALMLGLLAACGTPQEQCIARGTVELRTLDRLIAEAQGNIARGYALDEFTVYERDAFPCVIPQPKGDDGIRPPPERGFCDRVVPVTETRPRTIDLDGERAKLAAMQAKRIQVARTVQPAIDACRVAYPE